MGDMGSEREEAASERDEAEQKDAAPGQPDAALPLCWRHEPPDAAHDQHRREGA